MEDKFIIALIGTIRISLNSSVSTNSDGFFTNKFPVSNMNSPNIETLMGCDYSRTL